MELQILAPCDCNQTAVISNLGPIGRHEDTLPQPDQLHQNKATNKVIRWWGFDWAPTGSIEVLYEQWCNLLIKGIFQIKARKLLFFIIIWSIWIERNAVVFRNKVADWTNVYSLVFVRFQTWVKLVDPHFPYSNAQMQDSATALKVWSNGRGSVSVIMHRWSHPTSSQLKWNVDGSSLGKPGRAGVGGILRDSNGTIKCLFSCYVGVCESNEAELKAIHQALRLTSSSTALSEFDVIIETDSLNAYRWVEGVAEYPWKLAQLANSIGLYQLRLRNISLSHIKRSTNNIADLLAKEGTRRSSDFIVWF